MDGTPLLAVGQTVTNDIPVTFANPGNVTEVWLEALAPGTAEITFSFIGTGNAEGFNHADTLKVMAQEPEIQFKAMDGAEANSFHVAKWENAFDSLNILKNNFIDIDPDRFRVKVTDLRRTEASISINIYTGTSFSAEKVVSLYRQKDGTYLSTNLLLVADNADESYNKGRLLLADNLGYMAKAEYKHDGVIVTNTFFIGANIKTATVDFAVMILPGTTNLCVNLERIEKDLQVTKERFMQADIVVQKGDVRTFMAPPLVATNLSNWTIRLGNDETNRILTAEAKAVVKAANPTLNGYCLIYVPSLRSVPNSNAWGSAIADYYYKKTEDADYLGNSFISVAADSFTPPHELGHIWALVHSVNMPWNLMHPQTFTGGVTGTKRLTEVQVNTIRGKIQ